MPEQREGEALLQRDLEIASKVYRAEYERHQQTKAALAASQEREQELRRKLEAAQGVIEAAREVCTGLALTAYEGRPIFVWSAKNYGKQLGDALATYDEQEKP